MKAIRYYRYGSPDQLRLEDVPVPRLGPDRVLVRVVAASVNPYDWHFLRGKPYVARTVAGLGRPKEHGLGADLAGVVEAVGSEVSEFSPGDDVFGMAIGTLAEFTAVRPKYIVEKPGNVSFEQAAATPLAALTALQGLRAAGDLAGRRILINGASGGIGTFAIQLARSFGAHVTGVCSTPNVAMVSELGADAVIDYRTTDLLAIGERFDVVFDLAGNHSLRQFRSLLAPTGTLVLSAPRPGEWFGPLSNLIGAAVLDRFVGQRLVNLNAVRRKEDFQELAGWLADGTIVPVIDRRYMLAESADAIRYLETGRARGKVVVTIGDR